MMTGYSLINNECIRTNEMTSADNTRLIYTDIVLSENLICAVIEKISASSSLMTHMHTVTSQKRESKSDVPNSIEIKKTASMIKETAVRMTDNLPARLLGKNFITPPPPNAILHIYFIFCVYIYQYSA